MPAPAESDYPVEVSAETSDLTGNPVTQDERSEMETTLHPQQTQSIQVSETFDPSVSWFQDAIGETEFWEMADETDAAVQILCDHS